MAGCNQSTSLESNKFTDENFGNRNPMCVMKYPTTEQIPKKVCDALKSITDVVKDIRLDAKEMCSKEPPSLPDTSRDGSKEMEKQTVKEGNLLVHTHGFIKKRKVHFFKLFSGSKSAKARLQQYSNAANASLKEHNPELVILGLDVVNVACLPGPELLFVIQCKDHGLYLETESDEERNAWLKAIEDVLLSDCVRTDASEAQPNESEVTVPHSFEVYISEETQIRLGDDKPAELLVEGGTLSIIANNSVRLVKWPIHLLRSYGFEKNSFYVEAGRNTELGEGKFKFLTIQGETIHKAVKAAKKLGSSHVFLPGTNMTIRSVKSTSATSFTDNIYDELPFEASPPSQRNKVTAKVCSSLPNTQAADLSPRKPPRLFGHRMIISSSPPGVSERTRQSLNDLNDNCNSTCEDRSSIVAAFPIHPKRRMSGGSKLLKSQPSQDTKAVSSSYSQLPQKSASIDHYSAIQEQFKTRAPKLKQMDKSLSEDLNPMTNEGNFDIYSKVDLAKKKSKAPKNSS